MFFYCLFSSLSLFPVFVVCGTDINLFLTNHVLSYVFSFEEAMAEAIARKPEARQAKRTSLLETIIASKAHPSAEHILPMYIAAGAAGSDTVQRTWAQV